MFTFDACSHKPRLLFSDAPNEDQNRLWKTRHGARYHLGGKCRTAINHATRACALSWTVYEYLARPTPLLHRSSRTQQRSPRFTCRSHLIQHSHNTAGSARDCIRKQFCKMRDPVRSDTRDQYRKRPTEEAVVTLDIVRVRKLIALRRPTSAH